MSPENKNTNKPDVTCSVCGALLCLEEVKSSEKDMAVGTIRAPMCDSCFEEATGPEDEEDWEDEDEDSEEDDWNEGD